MKTINILLLLIMLIHPCINSLSASNNNENKAELIISYVAKFRNTQESRKIFEDEKILEIGKDYSAFYCLWNTRRDEVKDSVIAQGGTFYDVLNAVEKLGYPLSLQNYTVYKNYPDKGTLTYTEKNMKRFRYTEKMEQPVWTMEKGDSVILGYPCQQASTTFRGRTWRVWFTPNIPISDGPWKLYGLPGLILQADETADHFSFQCISIKKGTGQPVKTPRGKFIECTREKLVEMQTLDAKDPMAFMRMLGYHPGKA